VRTHTYQYKLTTPVPDSTPPEHMPNTEDGPFEPFGPPAPASDAGSESGDDS
jgi:hypothetical protein